MNTETKNRPVRKAAVIIGFVAILVLIAWLSITIVKNVPGSFASLASLAESVRSFDAQQVENSGDEATLNNRQNMLIVTSDTNVISTGDDVRLSWTDASTAGSFVFSYECTDGVAIAIVDDAGTRSVGCDTNYNLGDVNNITLNIASEKERFADIPYSLSFLATDDTTPRASDDAVLTVINEAVPVTFGSTTQEPEETPEVVVSTPEPEVEEPEVVVSTPEPEPETTGGETTFEQEFTFTIPVSDPNGRVDLAIRFIDIGEISGNSFVAGSVDNDETGAIQFEVKNFGSKTSEEWTYEINLPSGGMIESDDQEPLKPNERAIITIGFPPSSVTSHTFEGSVDTTGDNTSINDRFVETVSFSN